MQEDEAWILSENRAGDSIKNNPNLEYDKPPYTVHLTYTRKKRHARHVTPQNEAAYVAAAGQAGGTLGSLVLGWGDIKEMGA